VGVAATGAWHKGHVTANSNPNPNHNSNPIPNPNPKQWAWPEGGRGLICK